MMLDNSSDSRKVNSNCKNNDLDLLLFENMYLPSTKKNDYIYNWTISVKISVCKCLGINNRNVYVKRFPSSYPVKTFFIFCIKKDV